MAQQPAPGDTIITRTAVAQQIEARLAGRVDDVALAAWALDRFYALELGAEQAEAGFEAAISGALDDLMFGDEPGFRLGDDDLRGLLARLGSV
ncbi:MAG TPA: hypothetical protein PLO33_08570 [Kouleothrix sp.]|uniref:hypothetical protein n=1 Tax=Kouleothrix sp. TaxID=2779161 RepID=UPI002CFE3CB4|nr:hypothetical protein [Kouleothrix sp.]HRC75719.1 hypothetical protein [Kouleothrix sp.]